MSLSSIIDFFSVVGPKSLRHVLFKSLTYLEVLLLLVVAFPYCFPSAILTMAEINDSQQLHIAALTFPFGTHAAPLLALLRLLATSLPPTTILSFLSTEKSNTQIFTNKVDPSGTITAYNVWDGIPEEAVEGQVFRGNVQAGAEFFLKAVPGNFKKAMREAETESGVKISCILSDAFLWFSGDLAAEMGVPWVAFWTAGSCALSVHMYTDEIRNMLGMPGEYVFVIYFVLKSARFSIL